MPAITSTQLTERSRRSKNLLADKQKLFEEVEYFVAQTPAADDFYETRDGYFKGHKVIPGPMADPRVSPVLNVRDITVLEQKHFIRFVDNLTTDNADEHVRRAIYTIMTPGEAEEYNRFLYKLRGIDWDKYHPKEKESESEDGNKRVSRKASE